MKRFSFTRILKDKLDTFIDFPFEGLDLSEFHKSNTSESPAPLYDLFAVSNHFGMAFGGHYTAYGKYQPRGEYVPADSASTSTSASSSSDSSTQLDSGAVKNHWFNFDDSRVNEIDEGRVKSSNAYLLFYKRRDDPVENA